MRIVIAVVFSAALLGGAIAQEQRISPTELKKPSEILAAVEARQGFALLKRVDYSDGQYRVEYYMDDGAEVSVTYDARTGRTVPPSSDFPLAEAPPARAP